MQVKILIPFTFEVDRKAIAFEPGLAEMPKEAADAFVRAGYAAYIDDEPAVKVVSKPQAKGKAQVK